MCQESSQEFPVVSVGQGSAVVTAVTLVNAVVRAQSLPWDFYMPRAWPKI